MLKQARAHAHAHAHKRAHIHEQTHMYTHTVNRFFFFFLFFSQYGDFTIEHSTGDACAGEGRSELFRQRISYSGDHQTHAGSRY